MSALVAVFPGQGTQRAGMGREAAAASPAAAAAFDEASAALGLDLAALCFGADPRLALTEFAQPAILAVEVALLRALRAETAFAPTHFAGHSLGEYAALVAAGVLSLGQAAVLVRERGRRMQEAVPAGRGAMVAVAGRGVDAAAVAAVVEPLGADVAGVNAPGQVVISGLAKDVARAVERLRGHPCAAGAAFRPLDVSAPFHSRHMAAAEPAFRALLERASAEWDAGRARCVTSNVTGGFHTGRRGDLVDALARQLSAPVRWEANMAALAALRPARIVELGPSTPLRALFQLAGVRVDAFSTLAAARAALANPRAEAGAPRVRAAAPSTASAP